MKIDTGINFDTSFDMDSLKKIKGVKGFFFGVSVYFVVKILPVIVILACLSISNGTPQSPSERQEGAEGSTGIVDPEIKYYEGPSSSSIATQKKNGISISSENFGRIAIELAKRVDANNDGILSESEQNTLVVTEQINVPSSNTLTGLGKVLGETSLYINYTGYDSMVIYDCPCVKDIHITGNMWHVGICGGKWDSLESVTVEDCPYLTYLEPGNSQMAALESISVSNTAMNSADFSSLPLLKYVQLENCPLVTASFKNDKSLEEDTFKSIDTLIEVHTLGANPDAVYIGCAPQIIGR